MTWELVAQILVLSLFLTVCGTVLFAAWGRARGYK